jgi:hypothetical protein
MKVAVVPVYPIYAAVCLTKPFFPFPYFPPPPPPSHPPLSHHRLGLPRNSNSYCTRHKKISNTKGMEAERMEAERMEANRIKA